MSRQEDEAYVLATHPLGEADLIVTLLARGSGKVRAVARSARASRKRFGGRLEPLTRVRASWLEREGRELHRLEKLESIRSFAEMQADPARQAACAVLAELSITFGHEGQAEPEFFRLLGAVLEAMERGTSPAVLLRYFEFWTLQIHGLLPDLEHEASLGERERSFLGAARHRAPHRMPDAAAAGAGGKLERFLRGTLEAFAERRFRTYRHFNAVQRPFADGEHE